jgi:hypothetical protein
MIPTVLIAYVYLARDHLSFCRHVVIRNRHERCFRNEKGHCAEVAASGFRHSIDRAKKAFHYDAWKTTCGTLDRMDESRPGGSDGMSNLSAGIGQKMTEAKRWD